MFSIDSLPVTEAAKAKDANMENLHPKAEMDAVEKPKSETKITKNLDETEENSQADLKDDRSSNFATNKDKDIIEFNHATKIENIITHESAQDAITPKTEQSEARKEGDDRQASTPDLTKMENDNDIGHDFQRTPSKCNARDFRPET